MAHLLIVGQVKQASVDGMVKQAPLVAKFKQTSLVGGVKQPPVHSVSLIVVCESAEARMALQSAGVPSHPEVPSAEPAVLTRPCQCLLQQTP